MATKLMTLIGVLVLALAMMGCGSGSEGPAAAADFYQGNTVTLVVAAGAGTPSDMVARIMASYLERDTGASVVVTNRAGAGGLDGMNYLYSADPDGLTLGIVNSVKFVANEVLDEPAAVYDIAEFSYIMNVGRGLYFFLVSPDGPYQSVDDLQAGEGLKIGGSSPSGAVSLGGMTVIKLLDLDATVVTGFEGEANRAPAVKRGEIAGYVMSVDVAQPGIEANMVRPLFVLASERDPLQPDVPAVAELVDLTDDDLALVGLWETALVSSNMIAGPPGMPEDRLAFLRGLVDSWVEEEAFRQQIDVAFGYEVADYKTGEAVASAMTDVAAALDGFRTVFAEMIEKYRA